MSAKEGRRRKLFPKKWIKLEKEGPLHAGGKGLLGEMYNRESESETCPQNWKKIIGSRKSKINKIG